MKSIKIKFTIPYIVNEGEKLNFVVEQIRKCMIFGYGIFYMHDLNGNKIGKIIIK